MSGRVEVIGRIWQPGIVAAYSYNLTPYDIENMRGEDGKIARREIQDWLDKNAGDFSEVTDFAADIDGASYGWKDEESEMQFFDCLYGAAYDED